MKHTCGRKLLSLVCALALTLTMIPAVFAASGGGDDTDALPSGNHTLAAGAAVLEDGTLVAWGPGLDTDDTDLVSLGSDFIAVSRYKGTYLALKEDGTLWSWGQLQDGDYAYDRLTYITNEVAQIDGCCILSEDGTVWSLIPVSGVEEDSRHGLFYVTDGAVQVTSADGYGACLKVNGTIWNWYPEDDADAVRGLGRNGDNLPGQVANNVEFVAGNLFIKDDGSLWAWGVDTYGILGNGTGEDNSGRYSPVRILTGVSNAWFSGNLDRGACFAVSRSSGTLYSWGYNEYGALGYPDANRTTNPYTPGEEKIPFQDSPKQAGISSVVDVVSTYCGTMVLKGDGSVWAVGYNDQADFPENGEEHYDKWTKIMDGVLVPDADLKDGSSKPTTPPSPVSGTISGSLSMDKLSKDAITQLLRANSLNLPSSIYSEVPSTKAPYSTGALSSTALTAATNRLNAMRRIAGLPAVTLDSSLTDLAQHGAVLVAANNVLSHYPSQPGDMDYSFYQKGYAAASSSNIAMGYTLTNSVDGFLDDSSGSNISLLGHRRWLLNPVMGKVGFGMAGNYVDIYSFDRSGSGTNYDFISWPSSGNFPSDLIAFTKDSAWSVTLNPQKYQTPTRSGLFIMLTRESDQKTWTFYGSGSYDTTSGPYLNVETSGYGVNNCIIFRPDGVDNYEGVYTVTIQGLRTSGGSAATVEYQVDFFDTDPDPTFTDVPKNHWAFSYIELASSLGLVNGTGDGKFSPADLMSTAQFAAMITRAYYPDELAAVSTSSGDPWWKANIEVAEQEGLLEGTRLEYGLLSPDDIVDRFDMAQITYNLLNAQNRLPDDATIEGCRRLIADYSTIPNGYREAAAVCFASRIITGVDTKGTFAGTNSMTRAEAATVLARLLG